MRAFELNPAAADGKLRQVDRPVPTPGPHDVVIRVRATSLNFRDLLVADNVYGVKATSLAPLSDGAGEVSAIGDSVTRFAIGDKVAAAFHPDWLAGPISAEAKKRGLGGSMDGMLAEYVMLPETAFVALPPGYTFEEGACLPCAAVTAWHALVCVAQLRPGETVLLQGTGGVSIFALQLAKAAGARVIHTSSSEEKMARLRDLGADHVINYRENPDWDKTVLELTGGRGVDIVVEVGGPGTLERSLSAIRVGGTIATIGFVGGGSQINPRPIIGKAVRLTGVLVGSVEMFTAMNRAIEQNRLRPVIDEVFPIERAEDAYARLRSGNHFGKIVITI